MELVIPSGNANNRLSELISLLEKMLPQHNEIKETLMIDDVINFSTALKSLGIEHGVDSLTAYSRKLHRAARNFDAYQMEKFMDEFPNMIDNIKKII
jgi:hypothetical protein